MDSDDGYKRLAADIVICAINDFRRAAKIIKSIKGNIEIARKEIESIISFIQSEWFHTLTTFDPESLLDKLMEELDDD
jgi:transcription initiation factor TFIIIB Brf1 subunit/transcription initiation factor TFIIB